jgi:hypothetical protein
MQAWFAKWIRHTDLGGKHAARKLRMEESERRPSSPQVQTQKREVRAKEVKNEMMCCSCWQTAPSGGA